MANLLSTRSMVVASSLTRAMRPSIAASISTSSRAAAAIASLTTRPYLFQPTRLPISLPSSSSSPAFTSRSLSTQTRSAISSATHSSPIVLFMKGTPDLPQCGFSRTTLQILGLQGVDPSKFTAYNVLEDEELRQGIKEYSNWPTIPQLYVDGEFVGGCDVLMEMHKDGSLAELLESKGYIVTEDAEGEAK